MNPVCISPTKELAVIRKISGQHGEEISNGAYGQIFLVKLSEKEQYIHKEIKNQEKDLPSESFMHEVSAFHKIAQLDKKNGEYFVKYYGMCYSPEYSSIYLEFVEIGDLSAAIRRHIFTDANSLVRQLIDEIFQAINALYSVGLIHNDIKQANILVKMNASGKYRLLLTDFGLTFDVGLTVPHFLGGTFPPPENPGILPDFLPNKFYDYRASDIWSLGITCLQVITGDSYFYSDYEETKDTGSYIGLSNNLEKEIGELEDELSRGEVKSNMYVDVRGLLANKKIADNLVEELSKMLSFDYATRVEFFNSKVQPVQPVQSIKVGKKKGIYIYDYSQYLNDEKMLRYWEYIITFSPPANIAYMSYELLLRFISKNSSEEINDQIILAAIYIASQYDGKRNDSLILNIIPSSEDYDDFISIDKQFKESCIKLLKGIDFSISSPYLHGDFLEKGYYQNRCFSLSPPFNNTWAINHYGLSERFNLLDRRMSNYPLRKQEEVDYSSIFSQRYDPRKLRNMERCILLYEQVSEVSQEKIPYLGLITTYICNTGYFVNQDGGRYLLDKIKSNDDSDVIITSYQKIIEIYDPARVTAMDYLNVQYSSGDFIFMFCSYIIITLLLLGDRKEFVNPKRLFLISISILTIYYPAFKITTGIEILSKDVLTGYITLVFKESDDKKVIDEYFNQVSEFKSAMNTLRKLAP